MKLDSLQELYIDELRDIYDAENAGDTRDAHGPRDGRDAPELHDAEAAG